MIRLHNADCFEVFPQIASGTVDLVCADIPYGTTQYRWDSVLDLALMWEQLYRIVKPSAAIVLFSAQPFTSVLINSNLRDWRSEWIWEKGNATGFLNAKKQPLRAHENIEVFYRRQPTYNPQFTHGHERRTSKRKTVNSECYGKALTLTKYDSTSRYPRDVQFFSSDKQTGNYHPTQKPLAPVQYLIETYSNPGDTVLDFTMGSGTAGVACQQTERNFIGIEKDAAIYRTACERMGIKQERAA
ncbi:TPA: site-specific DNA-methyltransferase [Klebsiella pneumoniae]|uniref:DNA-methyltransferase n=1 Tax=Klebsiella pneumoniae TaxID=573 RepID=UPI001366438A|nr:site-specific DNA-methyltransferase [Klebsiella pneumoniae]HBX3783075.1 site-specific DNA-methyltransferase [Klebsiella pneumoniae subsp. pneumoniae]EKW0009162.1 site-specific DNA-methyltransferase [Klebsiella pneumoniae]EKY1774743.1 site-specific DNA-methyltransferase [Klebsiella pneumoniae]EKZ6016765.1 site-specific DNA-methyltransferase [Klebsiella pneumoniae]ELA0823886.1 site-specific DNA-methyltransferase [Klebsiella pneumoniae]